MRPGSFSLRQRRFAYFGNLFLARETLMNAVVQFHDLNTAEPR